MSRHRSAALVVALAGAVAMLGTACGLDSSSSQDQNETCRTATVGKTTRADVQRALGDPTITDHETLHGVRVVSDLWVDGTVGFSFDERDDVLVEKDCG
jgi:hypothetical protein